MDDVNLVALIVYILATMVLSAFFSGMEIAFVSSNRMLAEMEKDKFVLSRLPLKIFYKYPNNLVSTMLVGNNIVLVVYGILIAKLFDSTIFSGLEPSVTVPLDTVLSTTIVLFTGEFLPKSIFKSNANRLLTAFAFPAFIFYILLWPISKLSTTLSHVLMRIAGIKVERGSVDEIFSKIDLDHLVQSSIEKAKDESQIDDDVKIFQNALEFPDTKVRDCMVPRTEICAVEYDSSVADLKNAFIESGKSKIIVYREDIDHIIGYIHSSEMFRDADNWHNGIQNMPFVPETMPANKLMQTFMQKKKTLGVVIDEFGGTSGIVSLEDIVEEIFGDIEDEHDNSNYVAKQISENEFILSARLEIDKVNEKFNVKLPESEEYMTIGGLILNYYQSFPKLNEVVTIGDFEFKIVKNTMTKIELVRLKVLK